jgi:hypothetical protein
MDRQGAVEQVEDHPVLSQMDLYSQRTGLLIEAITGHRRPEDNII